MYIDGQEFIQIRRELHRIPELGYNEFQTGKYIAEYLKKIGVDVTENIAKTGVLGMIRAKNATKTLLLRADMDALELDEENDIEYKSKNSGMMHACGHDVHMAILLGVAKSLKSNIDQLNVNVKFMFQPGEEGFGGALPMIEEGILENPRVDAALAFHVMPDIEVGSLLLTKGAVTASPDNFDIIVKGRGGHGAMPEKNIDSIHIGALIACKLKTLVKDYIDPKEHAVVSVCSISGGTNYNVMPDTVALKGTFRSFCEETRQKIAKLIEKTAKDIAGTYHADCMVNINFLYPSVHNNQEILKKIEKSSKNIAEILWTELPQTWGEDFSYISNTVPSCMALLGCGNKQKGITAPLHSSHFAVDEACIPLGIQIMTEFALQFD